MRWRRRQRSGDLIDARGRSGSMGRMGGLPIPMGGRMGIPALLAIALMIFLGGNFVGGDDTGTGGGIDDVFGQLDRSQEQGEGLPPGADPDRKLVDFMSFVLDDVQNTWERLFADSGRRYQRAKLVLFTRATNSACGGATSDIGPHYCPADQRVYLDLDFFRELRSRFGAPGDFAQAYVLAHEIGHHVQNILGVNEEVRREQQASPDEANELSIRLELQADCLAGVWAYGTYERGILETGDIEEGIDAAAAVGDDRLQQQAGGGVNRETWTHGSSEQRVRWFRRGFDTGDPNSCDTFSTQNL